MIILSENLLNNKLYHHMKDVHCPLQTAQRKIDSNFYGHHFRVNFMQLYNGSIEIIFNLYKINLAFMFTYIVT